MKFVTIIGARPQFIKAAAISRAILSLYPDSVQEVMVHTGQHYDANMSQVFFDEMKIPRPDYMLDVGSASHGKQTGMMIDKIEQILLKEKPDCVILYGDTNSTLAGAIAASKLYLPVAHVEAGLRSFNKTMPEEINRILCDHVSTFLFSPTKTGLGNLIKEGFAQDNLAPYNMDNPKVYHCGDVMYDNTLFFSEYVKENIDLLDNLGLVAGEFILATIHRNTNTDVPEKLTAIFEALLNLTEEQNQTIVLPLHPRTKKVLDTNLSPDVRKRLRLSERLKLIMPVSFLEMTALEGACKMVITDSGGVQKEAFFLEKPCIVLRPETEWVELVETGTAVLADADKRRILDG
ncbi:MAG TPA: UDP-N-acetylglucosamine 2-epimerase (non-hydrolyzing), partial [Bacteroidetes bacterium]|nr:UDP-N-acetylglucosamine 2-epimerase (non-hydrolyzing) [Bacteroidota bacterium]